MGAEAGLPGGVSCIILERSEYLWKEFHIQAQSDVMCKVDSMITVNAVLSKKSCLMMELGVI